MGRYSKIGKRLEEVGKAVFFSVFIVCGSAGISPALSTSPLYYYHGISEIYVSSYIAVDQVIKGEDIQVRGVISAREISKLAERTLEHALSHREDIKVESTRAGDSRILAPKSLAVLIGVSLTDAKGAGSGLQGQIIAISVDVYRAHPPANDAVYFPSFPAALEVPSDRKLFRKQLNKTLTKQLVSAVIRPIKMHERN